MHATYLDPTPVRGGPHRSPADTRLLRISARFGLAFTTCQLAVMAAMALVVLPRGGSPSDPAVERGTDVFAAEYLYRLGNFAFMVAGMLMLGFLGVVAARLRAADSSGVLATVAVASGALLALIWPMTGMLHDVALEAAGAGSDPRILAGWDSVAPFGLAFSVLPRLFFVGAIVASLYRTGRAPWLRRTGVALLPLGLVGSATLVFAGLFPVLAVSTLGYELWIGALAWHWLRTTDR
ncbi:hypothetical protein OG921_06665 [Aldersonia sp. NBC_00410]|uniref:hypothetical protein n=1 Tax=Aldersonia sp. NBC_00410 TaxID=2975954 RepID=UPI0022548BC2|nr:hypothetical protein [Aldersonia sp. NBC_00410]MCX5042848.1 hypothetical protein [Aldersonia sp. NBC_00410]